MFRWKYLVPALVVVAILAAIPTAITLRHRYCVKNFNAIKWLIQSETSNLGFLDEDPVESHPEVIQKWMHYLETQYPPESDSWRDLPEPERVAGTSRFWTTSHESQQFDQGYANSPVIPGGYFHGIYLNPYHENLSAECLSDDGRFLAHYWITSDGSIRLLEFKDLKRDSDVDRFELAELGTWAGAYHFDDVNYELASCLEGFSQESTQYDFHWSKHLNRFENSQRFIETSLATLDELEAHVEANLSTNQGYRWLVIVDDLLHCQCRLTKTPANRPLTPAEKEQILHEARTEINRRRELIKTHGQVWFETLNKILIPFD